MAFNLEKMTVDYKNLLKVIPTQRIQLAQSGALNDLISALTPGQIVNLFPRYYREQLPDVGQVNAYNATLDVALSGGLRQSGIGSTGTGTYTTTSPELKKTLTPAEKSLQSIYEDLGLSQAPLELGGDKKEKAASLTERMMSDLGIPREKAVAIVGNFMHESADFSTMQEIDPTSGRGGYGWAQWTGVRRERFENFAAEKGLDINSDEANYQYFLHEIQNDPYERERFEKWKSTDFGSIAAETTAFEEAYERAGVKHHGSRIQRAETALQAYEERIAAIESDVNGIKDLSVLQPQFDASMLDQLDERYKKHYETANEGEKRRFEQALSKLGPDKFNEVMKNQPINSPTLQAAGNYSKSGPIANAAIDPNAVGGKRKIPLTEHESGIKILNRMNWVSEQTSAETGEKISYRVFSALQPPGKNDAERGGEGTGGYRHGSNVGAADVELLATDADGKTRVINAYSEGKDKLILQSALKYIGKSGFTGVGIGKGYQGGNLHVGFGNPHLWNSEASGDPMKSDYAESIRQGQREAGDQGFDFDSYYAERQKKYEEEMAKKISAEAEALRAGSPVEAGRLIQEQNEKEAKANTPVPSLATGGTIIPGEDIAGINMNTGNVEFMANSREKIRVDPAELESKQQMPVISQDDMNRLEAPRQPLQTPAPRVNEPERNDPNFYNKMADGYSYMPPSILRATNRAKLYGEENSGIVNGHFS